MSRVAVSDCATTVAGLRIPVSPTEVFDGEEMKVEGPHNGSGALDGKLEALVLSGREEARGSAYDEAEAMRRLEADKRRVSFASSIQETLAEKVSDSACRCQMDGEGMGDVTGCVLDTKVTVKSPTTMTKSALESRDSGEMKEVTEGKEEAPNNFLESARTIGKYEATSAASDGSMGNIPDWSELDSRNELLEPSPGHRKNGSSQSGFSMSGKQIWHNHFVDEHMGSVENVEATEDKILPLNRGTFFIDYPKEIEEKECPCDDSGIPFENISTSYETRGAPNIELNYSTLTDRKTNKKYSNNYSIEKLLALRFINVEEQQERWTYIYNHLGPVARELDEISASEQPRKSRKNVDRRQRRKKLKDAVPEASCYEASQTDSRLSGESVTENVEEDHEYIGTNTSDYVLSVNTDAENVEKDHKDMGTVDHVLSFNADVNPAVEIECEEYEDSDDEYDSIQRPAFFVEGEPDFESGPPQDGFEYLRRVRWEAMQIPNVKVAKLDKSKLKVEQTPYMPSIPEIADCPNNFMPSQHWMEAFLTDFSELKQDLGITVADGPSLVSNLASTAFWTNRTWETSSNGQSLGRRAVYCCLPLFISLYLTFVLELAYVVEIHARGRSDTLTHVERCHFSSVPALSQMESSDIKTSSSRKIWDNQGGEFKLSCKIPLLSLILSLDAVSRAAILRRHIKALENSQALSRPDLEWAFALFVALDEPVDAETAASIRCLLRKCAHLRASKIDYDDDVVMMNIIITIAGKYFGQSEK